ncbi:hypothetical protein [Streptomyces sp. NPDC049949]|uniref:hypothetical protein n=1 Tax=Streptomyces sp. NPDC049949 TaxID=3154627 RepID=UPI0034327D8D
MRRPRERGPRTPPGGGTRADDGARGDHALIAHAHYAQAMAGAGAGLIVLADTVGAQLPLGCGETLGRVRAEAGSEVVLASHLHNDLGLGLANTLQAPAAGVRGVSSSWLGIAERAGMVATEQLLFLLARHAADVLGADAAPWWTPPGRVVAAVATRLGHCPDRGQTRAAMAWVKSRAYRTGRAVVDDTAFAGCPDGLTHRAAGGAP